MNEIMHHGHPCALVSRGVGDLANLFVRIFSKYLASKP